MIESPCLSTCATPAAGRVCGHAAAAPGPAHADASAAHDVFDPAEMLAGLAEANAMLSRLQVPGEQAARGMPYPLHQVETLCLTMRTLCPHKPNCRGSHVLPRPRELRKPAAGHA